MKIKFVYFSLSLLFSVMLMANSINAQSMKGAAIADIYGGGGIIAENVELGLQIVGDELDPSFIVSGWFEYSNPVAKTTPVKDAQIVFSVVGGSLGETTTDRCSLVLQPNGMGNIHCRTTGTPRNP